MATVADIVGRALRILRVLDPNEAPEAAETESAITALNQMARRWEADQINMGWQDVSNPADTLPAPPEAERALAFNLAMEMRPEYGVALEQDVVQTAMKSYNDLLRDRLVQSPLIARTALDGRGRFNIYTDSYNNG